MASGHDPYGASRGFTSMNGSSGNYRSGQYGQQQQQYPADAFTAEMRDRQARGKDPYRDSGDSSDGGDWGGQYRSREESFAVVERRRQAAQVLDTPELLMMNAQRDNDSIPATRLRFTRMLCGVEEQPPNRKTKGSSTKSSSAKKSSSSHRTSSGGTPSSKRSGGGDRGSTR